MLDNSENKILLLMIFRTISGKVQVHWQLNDACEPLSKQPLLVFHAQTVFNGFSFFTLTEPDFRLSRLEEKVRGGWVAVEL